MTIPDDFPSIGGLTIAVTARRLSEWYRLTIVAQQVKAWMGLTGPIDFTVARLSADQAQIVIQRAEIYANRQNLELSQKPKSLKPTHKRRLLL